MGYAVVQKAIEGKIGSFKQITKASGAKSICQWKKAVAGFEGTDVDSLWVHLLSYFRDDWKLQHSTRVTAIGQVKAVTSRLGIPESGEFEDYYEEMRAQHTKATDYKEVPLEEAKAKFMCSDGKVLTTKKLRTMVDEMKNEPYERMLLSFFAYHGNRPQDWCVGWYGEMNKNERGYYDYETQTMHLFDGKTQKKGTERTFKVHDKVAENIALFKPTRYLAPNSKGECDRKAIYRKLRSYFQSHNNFPKGITPNDLRHLYETHIRYVEKLPRNERLKLMGGIAHSDSTSLKKYAKLYRPMVEWAEANEQ
jgi:integrase